MLPYIPTPWQGASAAIPGVGMPGAPQLGGYSPSLPFGGGGAAPGIGAPYTPGLAGGSVSGSHTSTAAETAFTAVTYTFPRPALPQFASITTSAGSGLVQIVLDNQRNLLIPWATNIRVDQNLSGIISYPVNALSVQFECLSGVATVTATLTYL